MLSVASELLPMPRPRAPRLSAPFLKRVVLDESSIENGIGKSTILAGIAAVAGYEDAGRNNSSRRVEPTIGDRLAHALRPSWLPKMTNGWFFRRQSFFSLMPQRGEPAPAVGAQLSSHSHDEEFLHFVE